MNDCVYYWKNLKWNKAILVAEWLGGKKNLSELRKSVELMGYKCVYGNQSIGAPEGPPK